MFYSKPLLFVDDYQAEVVKVDIPGNQPVGSNRNVDFSRLELFNDLAILFARVDRKSVV